MSYSDRCLNLICIFLGYCFERRSINNCKTLISLYFLDPLTVLFLPSRYIFFTRSLPMVFCPSRIKISKPLMINSKSKRSTLIRNRGNKILIFNSIILPKNLIPINYFHSFLLLFICPSFV